MRFDGDIARRPEAQDGTSFRPQFDTPGEPGVTSLDRLVGNTPLVELTRLDTGPCRLFAKLESCNPSGSIKDRIAAGMIDAAACSGRLAPGGTIVEATAGNTGLALAQIGLLKGYRTLCVVPDKMSAEKIQHLRALGAEVCVARSDVDGGHPEHYMNLARTLADRLDGGCFLDQFSNPHNPLAHERTTGPEILAQMGGDVDAVVVGVGSGGTLTGVGRAFRSCSPKTQIVLADPQGSSLAAIVEGRKPVSAQPWLVEGIGADAVPPNADLSLVSQAITISDRESVMSARLLLSREGILAGSSSGTLLAAALEYCGRQRTPKRVVTLVCDTGSRYFSKIFNDGWLAQRGWLS